MRAATTWMALLVALTACREEAAPLTVVVAGDELARVADHLSTIGDDRLRAVSEGDAPRRGLQIHLEADKSCEDCYQLSREEDVVTVRGGGLRDRLYGLAHTLEAMGYRFHHPYRSTLPESLAVGELPSGEQRPQVARRGLHLHTLHPIEGLYDFWIPGDPGRAHQVMDWVLRNRGNHLQWVSLRDILDDPSRLEPWQAHTRGITERAHGLGLSVGLGVQLYNTGNLQLAFDLLEAPDEPDAEAAEMARRLAMLAPGKFDVINLSFGEFSAEEPAQMVSSIERAYDAMTAALPGVEVTTVIHLGADLEVEWEGETTLYYFLSAYTSRPIVPWVHTTMYYALNSDPGGAYHHEDFDLHRGFLEERLASGEPVGYFPETAYWVAFDNSVPQYLPLYPRNRWQDLNDFPTLQDHVLFSSGWEWGYWLHDTVALRQSWKTSPSWCEAVGEAWPEVDPTPYCQLGDLQQTYLIDRRLTAYLASWDNLMELGYTAGIISQPRRWAFRDLVALDDASFAAWEAGDLANLLAYRDELAPIVAAGSAWRGDAFVAEAADGFLLAQERANFAAALFSQVPVARAGGAVDLGPAEASLAAARALVDRRHAALHDPQPERLITPNDNPTVYDFGYLTRSDELCYWQRELAQARNDLAGGSETVAGCSL